MGLALSLTHTRFAAAPSSAGDRLVEAQHINKSLSALGDVMAALANKKAGHVPYRNSKLTLLLEKSLSGAAKVMMLVHVSPEESSFNESVTTLKFGCRVSEITLGKVRRPKCHAAVGWCWCRLLWHGAG